METLENIPVELIVPPFVLLRLVDKTSLDYLELRDSIEARGFLTSLCVRPSYRQPGKYEIIEGVHRFCCALDLELQYVPCIIKPKATDAYLLECQVEANAISKETKPLEYAVRLKMFIKEHPEMDMVMLSNKIHKRPGWIKKILKLNNLSEEAKQLLDDEKIPLGSAHILAKLPYRVQDDLVPKAVDYSGKEFETYVRSFLKAFRESVKQGKMVKYLNRVQLATVQPRMRAVKQIQTERKTFNDGKLITSEMADLSPSEVWKMALAWCIKIDPISAKKIHDKSVKYGKNSITDKRSARKLQ